MSIPAGYCATVCMDDVWDPHHSLLARELLHLVPRPEQAENRSIRSMRMDALQSGASGLYDLAEAVQVAHKRRNAYSYLWKQVRRLST